MDQAASSSKLPYIQSMSAYSHQPETECTTDTYLFRIIFSYNKKGRKKLYLCTEVKKSGTEMHVPYLESTRFRENLETKLYIVAFHIGATIAICCHTITQFQHNNTKQKQ